MSNFLYYEKMGCGPEIVLLHGWGWHTKIFHSLCLELKESYSLTLVDLPGFGQSDPLSSSKYSLEKIANHLFSVVPKRAIWLGWSFGGLIALWVALYYPERVNSLVLVASSPCFIEDPPWPGIQRKFFETLKNSLDKNLNFTLNYFLNLQCKQDVYLQKQKKILKNILFSNMDFINFDLIALRNCLEILQQTDFRSDLTNIQCPTLFVFGEHDVLVPLKVMPHLKIHMPLAKLSFLPNVSHIPFFSKPEQFCFIVNHFFKSV